MYLSVFFLLYLCQCLVKVHYIQKLEILIYSKIKMRKQNPCLRIDQVTNGRLLRNEQYGDNQAP